MNPTSMFGNKSTLDSRAGRRSWLRIVVAVCGLVLLITLGTLGYRSLEEKHVVVAVVGQGEHVVSTRASHVADVLREAGIIPSEGDRVVPPLDATVNRGERIELWVADTVTVAVDGEERRVKVVDGTVRDALVTAGIRMGPLDRVVPVRETPLVDGMTIQVIRVEQREVIETESIPFSTVRWAEPQLPRGHERLVREGKEGRLETRVRLTYENGQLVHRQILDHRVAEEAVSRIIGIGTRDTANIVQTSSGPLRYTQVLEMEATAYYPGPESTGEWADGYTYTGLLAGPGVVAVDPTVIPLGTRLYIPGYGEAIAADIGGAIKGYKIDLGFSTYEEAIQYGRQRGVKVYVLAD